jgi:hypothetical protein
VPAGPPPTPYDLHNRLKRTEAALRATEKALEALFRKVNVNRKRDPELDAVFAALAAILHALEHARGDRSGELQAERAPLEMSLSVEEVRPENDPFGEPEAVRLYTQDADDEEKKLAAVFPTKLPEN